jgi:hypothetical protein
MTYLTVYEAAADGTETERGEHVPEAVYRAGPVD